jgi:hypothetical protein
MCRAFASRIRLTLIAWTRISDRHTLCSGAVGKWIVRNFEAPDFTTGDKKRMPCINRDDTYGLMALHLTVWQISIEVTRGVLKHGAGVGSMNTKRDNTLHVV